MPASRSQVSYSNPAHGAFMTTRWSMVVRATDDDADTAHKALESLCRDYWKPLYFFARRKGQTPEDAQDSTQGFIAKLLESGSFGRADKSLGKFRTFLIRAFCNYLSNQHRDQSALKRGGGKPAVSLEDPDLMAGYELQNTMTPERLYERTWALSLLEKVVVRLQGEFEKAGKHKLWKAIEPQLTSSSGRPGYAKLAAELEMTESALTVAVYRMKKRFGMLLREEIAATVSEADDVDEELRHLMATISGGAPRL